ncbi:hypothetical protein KRE49_09285 [Elizabethkingia meningoseptica]|uniref:hypothetical protein n=1 Tax=Elizabethkingia meningoseptica TaxID=238 RepID=UPI0021A546D1|nr:hypothetical protein [Elizabethkingia meningoseptica]MCT3672553.1 hypothetical protein [Elizabethkingia anophelis]MCT3680352.1 hypothetical protein [Elizabethkingia anophelis]MDE5515935.1 hypothetical protein [Elizabethkingia meningoseptica]
MDNIYKLGKITQRIGLVAYYLISLPIILFTFFNQLDRMSRRERELNDVMQASSTIGSLLALVIMPLILYVLFKRLFKPIYGFNNVIKQRLSNEISANQFEKKSSISKICTIIATLLFIVPTLGTILILTVYQLNLIDKTKCLIDNEEKNINTEEKKIEYSLHTKSYSETLNKIKDLPLLAKISRKLDTKETIIISVILGIISGLLVGYYTGEVQYYTSKGYRTMDSYYSIKVFRFNYLLFSCSCIVISGISYLYLSKKK